MDSLDLWALVVGSLLAPIIAVVQQPVWKKWFRAIVAVSASLVAGMILTWVINDDHLWGRRMLTTMLLVLLATLTVYRGFWKPLGVTQKIEEKTTVT